MFGDNLKDIQFSQWLCKEYKISDLKEILEWRGSKQGRPVKITKYTKIKVQDFWRENSIISVDHRNMRHFVRVAAKNVPKIATELLDHDAKVTKVTAKRGWKYQADRYVTTKTYRKLYQKFVSLNGPVLSYGSFVQLKPLLVKKRVACVSHA